MPSVIYYADQKDIQFSSENHFLLPEATADLQPKGDAEGLFWLNYIYINLFLKFSYDLKWVKFALAGKK